MICSGVRLSIADDRLDPLFDLGDDAAPAQVSAPFSSSLAFDTEKSELVLLVKVKQGAYVYRDSLSTAKCQSKSAFSA